MEMTQMVSSPPDALIQRMTAEAPPAAFALATISIELKPERVQEPHFAADGVETLSLSLNLTIHQPQTLSFSFSASGIAITFTDLAAPAAN